MFETKWLKSAQQKYQPLKVIAGDNFLSGMNNLEQIKQSDDIKGRDSKREEDYDKEYSNGIQFLKEFTRTKNFENLRKAANKFLDALKCKKSKVEPYYLLSYIFYVFNQRKSAIEYLEIAKSLDPAKPEIKKIQQLIYTNR